MPTKQRTWYPTTARNDVEQETNLDSERRYEVTMVLTFSRTCGSQVMIGYLYKVDQ